MKQKTKLKKNNEKTTNNSIGLFSFLIGLKIKMERKVFFFITINCY
jgi:hypothetical protein